MLKSLLANHSIWIHSVIFRNLTISKIVKNFEIFFKKTSLLCNQFVIEGLACFRLSYGNFKQNPVARSLSCKLFSTDWSMFFYRKWFDDGQGLFFCRICDDDFALNRGPNHEEKCHDVFAIFHFLVKMFTKIQIQLFFNNYYFCRNLNISLAIIFFSIYSFQSF